MTPILAKCFLSQSGDRQNMLILYCDKLIIIFKGKSMEFPLSTIKSLTIGRKKLIIPLVAGGIGTCLSWLALSLGWYHYQTNLFIVMLFFGWMYYGFLGKDGLELMEGKERHVFLIKANHFVLNSFLKFVKERIHTFYPKKDSLCFHLAHKKDWEKQELSLYYKHSSLESEGFIHASYHSELMTSYEKYFLPDDDLILLIIDLSKVEVEVKINHVTQRNADFPHIYGKLNKSAILSLKSIRNPSDFELKTID